MNGRVAVAAALGLILGLLAGLFVAGALPETTTQAVQGTATEVAAVPSTQVPTPAPAVLTLSDLIEQAELPAQPSGNTTIHGTIRTPGGRPLEGIRVTAFCAYPSARPWSELSLAERVEQEMKRIKWGERARHVTVTDAEGHYRFEGLASDVRYTVNAEGDGWELTPTEPQRRPDSGSRECSFIAEARITLNVIVLLPDGKPANRGEVVARPVNRVKPIRFFIHEDGTSSLYLTPGVYDVAAHSAVWSGDIPALRSEELRIDLAEGSSPDPVTLTFRPTPFVQGRIELPAGMIRPELSVHVQASPANSPPPQSIGAVRALQDAVVRVSDEGVTYHLADLPVGRHRVFLSSGAMILDWVDLHVPPEGVQHDFAIPSPDAGDYIQLRVIGAEGTVVTDVDVEIEGVNPSRRNTVTAFFDERGHIWLRRSLGGTEPEFYEIKIASAQHGERTVRYDAASTDVLEVHLQSPAFLVLELPGWETTPGKHLLTWDLQPANREGDYTIVRERRIQKSPIRLGPVIPGKYVLSLTLRVEDDDDTVLLRRELELISGENPVTEAVPELYEVKIRPGPDGSDDSLRVVSTNPVLNVHVFMRKRTNGETFASIMLPAGTYRLIARRGEMQITLPGSNEFAFQPRLYDCYVISLESPEGKLEALGLRDGDRLIEVDGHVLRMNREDESVLETAFASDSTTWVVLRNGLRTEVTFAPSDLMRFNRGRAGGERFHWDRGYQVE